MKLFNISIFSLLFFILLFSCDDGSGSGTYTGDGTGVCYLQTQEHSSYDEEGTLDGKSRKTEYKWKNGKLISDSRNNSIFYNEDGYRSYEEDEDGNRKYEYKYSVGKVEVFEIYNGEKYLSQVHYHSNGKLDSTYDYNDGIAPPILHYKYNDNEVILHFSVREPDLYRQDYGTIKFNNFDNKKSVLITVFGFPFTYLEHNHRNEAHTYFGINDNGDTLNYFKTSSQMSYKYNSNGYVTERFSEFSSGTSSKSLFTYDCK